ncbi:hypothetical protein [uncultured Schumannella sp.]|uniref:hypothetical protein n=1 Tax=uncultured Schumannella sp. TaxID=1195956 RepID=UPI0025D0E908|nr:hypothetical protein [uncultured Schumannella sp.]
MPVTESTRASEVRQLVVPLLRPARVAVAVLASFLTLAVLVSATGQIVFVAGVSTLDVTVPTAIALVIGSLLAGATFATFLRPPVGAEATVCDLRGPLIGSVLLGLGTDAGEASLVTGVAQPVLAVASLIVLGVGLYDRLRRERAALRHAERRQAAVLAGLVDAGDPGEVCLDCRPLFPNLLSTPKETP